jgi:hypothetical protein
VATALPVDERRLRLVAVSWAVSGKRLLASIQVRIDAEIKAQWRGAVYFCET